jgi:hypothetical protein
LTDFERFGKYPAKDNQPAHVATLLLPDALVQEFVLTVAHALALALVAQTMRPKPRNKP